jgi:hypothetical protein
MSSILGSVGRGGFNSPADVKTVQLLLNQNIAKLLPLMPVPVSGTCDDQTIATIEEFQRKVMQRQTPDGRIDPDGQTIAALGAPRAGTALDGLLLPAPAAKVLQEILTAANLSRATITSVTRTPADQARVMYENCVSHGAQFNRKLYAAPGGKVVDVYDANKEKSRDSVISLMLAKILAVGPSNVSKHCSTTLYVFDVDPGSIPAAKQPAFLAAVQAHKAVSKVLFPPTDPAYHIEIPKDSPNL